MPYEITVSTPSIFEPRNPYANVNLRFEVDVLEERIGFDGNEWRAAGFDQPDGNYQFFHPALILERGLERPWGGRREETATILWLHTGRVSRGHFTSGMYTPGEETPARAELIEAGAWPATWPDRSVSLDGCTVGPLPDDTVIQIAPVSALLEQADPQVDA